MVLVLPSQARLVFYFLCSYRVASPTHNDSRYKVRFLRHASFNKNSSIFATVNLVWAQKRASFSQSSIGVLKLRMLHFLDTL